jgi:hypothetical protein
MVLVEFWHALDCVNGERESGYPNQWEGRMPRGFCSGKARIWQRFLPHLEHRSRFSTVSNGASHPHKWANRLG